MSMIKKFSLILVLAMMTVNLIGLTACQPAATTTVPTTTAAPTIAPTEATTTVPTVPTVPTSVKESNEDYTIYDAPTSRDGINIYGNLYVPNGIEGKMPVIIISHGFNNRAAQQKFNADAMARNGYAVYIFDFIGGASVNYSGGSMLDMTISTEVADLNAVIDYIKGFDFIDQNNLFLMGVSQGGAVTALTAAKRPEEIKALILLFPAFSIPDNMKKSYPTSDSIPETVDLMGGTISNKYIIDAIGLDIYAELPKYTGDVLILHGTVDELVDISYSERAVEAFPSAELIKVEGSGHGFNFEPYKTDTLNMILEYLPKHVN